MIIYTSSSCFRIWASSRSSWTFDTSISTSL